MSIVDADIADMAEAYRELRAQVQRVLSLEAFDPRDVVGTVSPSALHGMVARHADALEAERRKLAEMVSDDPS